MGLILGVDCRHPPCGYFEELAIGSGIGGEVFELRACPTCQRVVAARTGASPDAREDFLPQDIEPRCPHCGSREVAEWGIEGTGGLEGVDEGPGGLTPGPCPECGSTDVAGLSLGIWD